MEVDKLMIEEFKQAGREYTFFQDLALKYLRFYAAAIGIVITAFLGISYHFSKKNLESSNSITEFLTAHFLLLCALFIIIMGVITGFMLLKCRTKCIESIKSMMRIRQFHYAKFFDAEFKKYSFYANIVPRFYKFLSTTQGILVVIAFINGIALTGILKGGIEKVFPPGSIFFLDLLPIIGLTFIQYMVIFKYLMKKDVVKVKLEFEPSQNIKEIEIFYNIPRSFTNNAFFHKMARILYWLIGLPESENILFLRRGKRNGRFCLLYTSPSPRD